MKKLRSLVRRRPSIILGLAAGLVLGVTAVGGYLLYMDKRTALEFKAGGITIAWLPETVTQYETTIIQFSRSYNLDPNFVAIIMTLESGGYAKADSGVAKGLMQVTNPTASDIAGKYLQQPVENYDIWKVETNIEFGVAYLAHLRNLFCDYEANPSGNNCALMVAAGYNGGPGAANQVYTKQGLEVEQTAIYANNALFMWRQRGSVDSPTYNRWLEAGGQRLVDAAAKDR